MLKKTSPTLLIIFAATILVSIWFRNGNIMGTGESGLPFYDFELQYKTVDTPWFNYGLGGSVNVNFASSPTYYVLWQFQKIGIPNFIMQAIFFWICLVTAGIAIIKLSKHFFPETKDRHLIAGVFFYWFNPISLVNVWNRFLNNYFIFFAFLPLGLYLFVKGLHKKSYYYCLLFAVFSAFFSYMHSSMAFNLLFWSVILFAAAFYGVILKGYKEKLFVVKYFLAFFLIWFVVNFWWISQVFSYVGSETFAEVTGSFFTNSGNYSSFSDLSQKLGKLTEILSFTHYDFYYGSGLPWFKFFALPFIKIFSYLIFFIILLTLTLKRRSPEVLFFSTLFIITLFLIKGNNQPFGEILSNLFINIPAFQLFRNPFEKFGFILVLALAPLFILSLQTLSSMKWRHDYLYWPVLIIVGGLWGYPYWTGLVFTANFPPVNKASVRYEVIVPEDYKQASEWLSSKQGDFRLVVFPLFGEGVTYDWEKGFSGIELSNQLLTRPSISFDTTVPFYHDIAEDIQKTFLEGDTFYPLMNSLNARYILLREDINWKERKMTNPQVIVKALQERESRGELKKVAVFGKLSFWENLHYSASEIVVSNSKEVLSDKPRVGDLAKAKSGVILVAPGTSKNVAGDINGVSKVYPTNRLTMAEFSEERYAPQYIFPHVSVYPENNKYPLILIKEKIQELFITDYQGKIAFKLQILGKRITEAVEEGKKGNEKELTAAINRYLRTIRDYEYLYKVYRTGLSSQKKEQLQLAQAEAFFKHLLLLKDLENLYKDKPGILTTIKSSTLELRKTISNLEIYPHHELKIAENFPIKTRLVYKYEVPARGDYQLLIKDGSLLKNFDLTGEFNIQINEELKTVTPQLSPDKHLNLGTHMLEEGLNEISFNSPVQENLVNSTDFEIEVINGETIKSFPVKNLIPGRKYSINFDYLIKQGRGPSVLLYTDNSSVNTITNKVNPELTTTILPDYYNFEEKHQLIVTGNLFGATQAELVFKLESWKSCDNIFLRRQEWCNKLDQKILYSKPSKAKISNLSVFEEFNEEPFLKKEISTAMVIDIPEVSYYKENPAKYEIQIKNAKESYYLTLSQLYDSAWSLKTEDGQKIGQGPFIANVFQNAWFINKPGEYKLILEYEPQKKLEFSSKISLAALLAITLLLIHGLRKGAFKND